MLTFDPMLTLCVNGWKPNKEWSTSVLEFDFSFYILWCCFLLLEFPPLLSLFLCLLFSSPFNISWNLASLCNRRDVYEDKVLDIDSCNHSIFHKFSSVGSYVLTITIENPVDVETTLFLVNATSVITSELFTSVVSFVFALCVWDLNIQRFPWNEFQKLLASLICFNQVQCNVIMMFFLFFCQYPFYHNLLNWVSGVESFIRLLPYVCFFFHHLL